MVLKERISLMSRLGQYFTENGEEWQITKEIGERQNSWFTSEFIDKSVENITRLYLDKSLLKEWTQPYAANFDSNKKPEVGIVMAGNIPLVGFHDFLSVFISGCRQKIKLSSKDKVLWEHIIKKLTEWNSEIPKWISFSDMLKGCDAYIATGSNNSARYFNYYFSKYPHIIRHNRSSAAILTGKETEEELAYLADDICLYYGLGCRNVTQLLVPEDYDFQVLEKALSKYQDHLQEPKYKNNYDYQLALILLNKLDYTPVGPILFLASDSLFAPLSVVHYKEYKNQDELMAMLPADDELQCLVAREKIGEKQTIDFGKAQEPKLNDYADGEDLLAFLNLLKKV